MIRDVEKIKKLPPRVGQSIMVKWLETGKIGGPAQAIQALCYECMGYFKTGNYWKVIGVSPLPVN